MLSWILFDEGQGFQKYLFVILEPQRCLRKCPLSCCVDILGKRFNLKVRHNGLKALNLNLTIFSKLLQDFLQYLAPSWIHRLLCLVLDEFFYSRTNQCNEKKCWMCRDSNPAQKVRSASGTSVLCCPFTLLQDLSGFWIIFRPANKIYGNICKQTQTHPVDHRVRDEVAQVALRVSWRRQEDFRLADDFSNCSKKFKKSGIEFQSGTKS